MTEPIYQAYLLNSPFQLGTITPRGAWNAITNYATGDSVSYPSGSDMSYVNSSYVAIQPSLNVVPTNTTYWQVLSLGAINPATIPLTTKGDIFTRSTTTTARLATGNDGEALLADSSQTTGNRFFPAQINVQKLTLGGTSYTDPMQGQDFTSGSITDYSVEQSLLARIYEAFDIEQGKVNHYGRSASRLVYDHYTSVTPIGGYGIAGGGWQTILQNIAPFLTTYPYTSPNGLCIGVWGINDVDSQSSGTVTDSRGIYKHSLRTVISRFRAGSVFESTDSSVVASGTTTAFTDKYINSGTGYLKLKTVGSKVTITTPSDFEGGTVALGFIGTGPYTGGTVNITLNGSNVSAINGVAGSTISTDAFYNGDTTHVGYRYGIVARIANVPLGTNTIVATVSYLSGGVSANVTTSSSVFPTVATLNSGGYGLSVGQNIEGYGFSAGTVITGLNTTQIYLSKNATVSAGFEAIVYGSVDFDYWQIETNYPNPVIIPNIAKFALQTNDQKAWTELYNGDIASVVSEFPSPIAVADWQELLLQGTNRGDSTLGIHPSRVGAQYLAEALRVAYIRSGAVLHDTMTPAAWNIKNSAPGEAIAPLWAYEGVQGFISQRGMATSGSNAQLLRGYIYCVPVLIPQACSVDQFIVDNIAVAGGTSTTCRVGLYMDFGGFPFARVGDFGTVAVTATGTKTFNISANIQTPGLYWLAIVPQGGTGALPSLSALTGGDKRVPAIASRNPSVLLYGNGAVNLTTGALPQFLTRPNASSFLGSIYPNWTSADTSPIIYLRLSGTGL